MHQEGINREDQITRPSKGRLLLGGATILLILFPLILSKYLVSIFVLVGIYSIAAVALSLLLGNTGQISLGQAAFYGIGAYTSAFLTTKLSLTFWLAMPAAGIVAAVFGYIVGMTSVRLRESYLAMATIAFNEIFIVIVDQWEGVTGGVGGFIGIKRPDLFTSSLFSEDVPYLYLVWAIFFLIFLFNRNLLDSRVGSTIRAICQDEAAAAALGIRVSTYKLKMFTLTAFYTGIAGSLFAHYSRYIGPASFSLHYSVLLLIMVELGGSGSTIGGVIGAAIVVLLPEMLSFMSRFAFLPEPVRQVFSEYAYHLIIYGTLLFVIAAFVSGGLAGLFARWIRSVDALFPKSQAKPIGVATVSSEENGKNPRYP